MEVNKRIKKSFSVIGKQGSTEDGANFIKALWDDANSNFNEVACLAKKNKSNILAGIWGLMSDLSYSFKPWEDNFTKGLYLAGIEVDESTIAPKGWVKWTVPSFEYIIIKNEDNDSFNKGLEYLKENNLSLVGAAHDFTAPQSGDNFIYFPIRKIID
ncbi:MAG: GyrI-like domain-containing protein [Pleomorphochaeta sp.]